MIYLPESTAAHTTTVLRGDAVQVQDVRHIRALELDAFGNLFLSSAHAINENGWLLAFDESTGEQRAAIPLGVPHAPGLLPGQEAPVAMTVTGDALFLASGVVRGTATRLARYTIDRSMGGVAHGVTIDGFVTLEHPVDCVADHGFGHTAAVTAITADADGSVLAVGFVSPRFGADDPLPGDVQDLFTRLTLGRIPAATAWTPDGSTRVTARAIDCEGLSLPVSAVLTRQGDMDADGDVDLNDFLLFQACFTGPEQPANDACAMADFDGDRDVDLADLVTFQSRLTVAPR